MPGPAPRPDGSTAGAQGGGSALLETHQLTKDFGGVHAVAGIDFRMSRGELRCLIGPNGAGKSTFFKMLTGQLQPTSGSILFDGNDITALPQHKVARLGIGIKNQVPSVWDGLSVFEHLWIAALRGSHVRAATARAEELLAALGLGAIARRFVGALSHGERQWVEIGMVMAQRPALMLLDEPTAGMAADEVEHTATLLREINRHTSIIVVEHDMQFIQKIAGIVTVFHQGRILVEGIIENVLANAMVREVYLGSGRAGG